MRNTRKVLIGNLTGSTKQKEGVKWRYFDLREGCEFDGTDSGQIPLSCFL
jgi:hypothetical protein